MNLASSFVAVRGVSLWPGQGEVFVIMGLSGSGKSTLIRCILRLTRPTSGEIWVNGQEVTSLSQKASRNSGKTESPWSFNYGLLCLTKQ